MISLFKRFGWFTLIGTGLLLTACGGGGGGVNAPGVSVPVVTAPAITVGPQSLSAPEGTTASFSVTATGTAPLGYQWQKNGVDIAGAAGPTYTTPMLGLADSGAQFSVMVSNSAGRQTSLAATLTVIGYRLSLDQPVTASIALGSNTSFNAPVIGAPNITYQWYRAGIAIEGANTGTLKISGASYGDDNVPYFVVANYSDKSVTSQPARLKVIAPTTPIAVAGCRDISTPGSYVLTRNIGPGASATACINIHDTQAVQLDCAGFAIVDDNTTTLSQPLEVNKVQHLSVKNCSLKAFFVNLMSSSHIAMTANTIVGTDAVSAANIQIWHTDRLVFDNNTLTGLVQQNYGSYVTFSNNRITGTKQGLTATIVMNYGAHNRILNNVLDGNWDGKIATGLGGTREGYDDGIVVSDTDDMVIADNLIQNVWDCGIEWVGTLSNSEIRDNRIVQAEYCGIGGWYFSSVLGTKFVRNTVAKAAQFFISSRVYGLRPAGLYDGVPADTVAYFKDNLFDGNVFTDANGHFGTPERAITLPLYDNYGYSGSLSSLPGEVVIPPSAMQIGNNVFKNNQFGKGPYAPFFGNKAPVSGYVIDGGNNTCSPPTQPITGYPLTCH